MDHESQRPTTQHPEAAVEGAEGNYMFFKNHTTVRIYYEVWYPGWFKWSGEIDPGESGMPYQPHYQDVNYEVHAWVAGTAGKCAYAWPIRVKQSGKQVDFRQLKGQFAICVSEK